MTTSSVSRINVKAYFWVSLFACVFGYLIVKNVQISPTAIAFLAALGGFFLFFKGLSRPEVVTYALVIYLPFSRELAGDFGGFATALNFTNVLMIFVVFVWLSGRYAKEEPMWISTPLNLPLFLFLVLGFISVFRGSYYFGMLGHAVIEYKRWITPILMYFLVLNTVKDKETIQNVVIMIGIVTAVVGLMAIYEYIDLGPVSSLSKARIGGICDQPNMLAAFFNYYMFLPLGFLLMNARRLKFWGLLVPFLISFRGIMVTFSRGGYLAFAVGLYAITFFRSKMLFLLLLIATWLMVLNPVFLPAGIQYRMGQTFEKNVDYRDSAEDLEGSLELSAQNRVEIWKGTLEMIKDHPFWGIGYGLFPHMIRHYWSGQKEIDAHNTYLIIAAEMGIPSLLVFLWIIWRVFRYTRILYKTTKDPFGKALALGFIGGLAGLLVSNMFGSRLDSQEVSSYFWILAALVMRLRILDLKEIAEKD